MKLDDEICKGVSCPECSFNKWKDGCLLAKRLDEIEITPEPCEEHTETHSCENKRTETHDSRREWYMKGYRDAQPRWIPVTEALPEEDKVVLISYRYKEGEGDTSHTNIDITTYGQMYFGGNKVGNHKYWRAPFEYFESNYEVVAWMPLPEPYAEGGQDEGDRR